MRFEWMNHDWGNGFYPPEMEHADLLPQLLMYGFVVPDQPMGDIPAGQIYGLGYDEDPNDPNLKHWKLDLLDVGLEAMLKQQYPKRPRQPFHY